MDEEHNGDAFLYFATFMYSSAHALTGNVFSGVCLSVCLCTSVCLSASCLPPLPPPLPLSLPPLPLSLPLTHTIHFRDRKKLRKFACILRSKE